MPDYQKMYYLLCRAVDDVIEPLENISDAAVYAERLKASLNAAEDIYIDTSDDELAI